LQLLVFVEVSCAEVYARLCSMERELWSGGMTIFCAGGFLASR
jgi:hypothetical protein